MPQDATIFNLPSSDPEMATCPVCGFDQAFCANPFVESGGLIGMGICCCCFFEPGFDDSSDASGAPPSVAESIKQYRTRWIEDGMPWRCTQAIHQHQVLTSDKIKARLEALLKQYPFLS